MHKRSKAGKFGKWPIALALAAWAALVLVAYFAQFSSYLAPVARRLGW